MDYQICIFTVELSIMGTISNEVIVNGSQKVYPLPESRMNSIMKRSSHDNGASQRDDVKLYVTVEILNTSEHP